MPRVAENEERGKTKNESRKNRDKKDILLFKAHSCDEISWLSLGVRKQ
jgi:hypothetical protein